MTQPPSSSSRHELDCMCDDCCERRVDIRLGSFINRWNADQSENEVGNDG